MTLMKCPDCGAQDFYAKDSDDQYNISEFSLKKGEIEYLNDQPETDHVQVVEDTEIFCDRCAWHDKLKTLKEGK